MLLRVQNPLENIKLIKDLINEFPHVLIEVFITNDEIKELDVPLENLIILKE
jgi:hypothetical protein